MKRYYVLDEWRGLIFLSMFLYHGIWDLVYLFDVKILWYTSIPGYIWQQSICWSFILLSGFCWSLGTHKYKRGIIIFFVGMLISMITCIFIEDSRVIFGILTFLGLASILTSLLQPFLILWKPFAGCLGSLCMFLITRNINQGALGFETWNFLLLPSELYKNVGTAFFGFPPKNFFSTDYFSLLPWIFLYWTGYFFFRWMKESQKNAFSVLQQGRVPFLQWMGKHSLILYILHQPLLFAFLFLIQKI